MSQHINELLTQIAYFQRRMFGRNSEKNLNLENQPSLFDAAGIEIPKEEVASVSSEEVSEEESAESPATAKETRKGIRHRMINIDNLPVLKTIVGRLLLIYARCSPKELNSFILL